jgi:hypothetical protein
MLIQRRNLLGNQNFNTEAQIMNANQQNKLAMFLAVLGVMDKYSSVWSSMTALAEIVTRLSNFTTSIQDKTGVQGTPLTGIAGGKRRMRMDMIQQALAIAGDLQALATKTNDSALRGKVAFELADLVRLNETLIAPRCQQIHDLAKENAGALLTYGVTAADITTLQTVIDAYTAVLTKPREAVVARKEVTGSITHDEIAADTLLKNELDPAMRKFKIKNSAFFGEYTSARMIIDLGERHEKAGTPSGGKLAPSGVTATGFASQTQPARI